MCSLVASCICGPEKTRASLINVHKIWHNFESSKCNIYAFVFTYYCNKYFIIHAAFHKEFNNAYRFEIRNTYRIGDSYVP